MKVLLFGSYPPPYGGLQVHVAALRDYLLRSGIPCAFINLDRHRKKNRDEIYYPRSALGVLWLLLRLRYDIVHLHVGGDLTMRHVLLSLLCGWLPWAKSVLTFHSGGYPTSPAGRAITPRSFRGFALRQLDGAVGVNEEITDFFRRAGVPANRTRLIAPHAMLPQTGDRPPQAVENDETTSRIHEFFERHDPVLATVGLLEPEYNLALQVEALGSVIQSRPGAGLVIIGSGSLEQELRRLIEGKQYADNILLCGDVPHPTTLRTIAECDVFLRTTSYDGDAISVREALHFGTPVIASATALRPDGVNLLEQLRPDALAGAVEAVLDLPHRPSTVEYGERNLEEVVRLYEQLTAP